MHINKKLGKLCNKRSKNYYKINNLKELNKNNKEHYSKPKKKNKKLKIIIINNISITLLKIEIIYKNNTAKVYCK